MWAVCLLSALQGPTGSGSDCKADALCSVYSGSDRGLGQVRACSLSAKLPAA